MRDGWATRTIAECLSAEFSGEWGDAPSSGGNATVLRSTDIDDDGHVDLRGGARRTIAYRKLQAKELQPGDILLEASGGGPGKPVGRVAYFGGDREGTYIVSNFFRTLRPEPTTTNGRFLAWQLQHLYTQPAIWVLQQQTTGIINLKYRDYLGTSLRVPRSVEEQGQIAAILDTIDNTIRKTEQIVAKLQQVKQGLLHDLLTRGIDDNGELRDPERYPEQFKSSRLGSIPKDWSVVRLDQISEFVTSGSRGWAAYYADSGALFVRIGNLTREHINLRFDSVQHVRPPEGGEGKRTALAAGDLLISITADLGIIGVVPDGLGEAYVNQHIALVRVDPERANSRWIGHYLAAGPPRDNIRRLDDAGAKAGLNLPTVRALLCALPKREERDELARRIDAVDLRVAQERDVHQKLRLLKQGLMDDLLTGRVRVTPLLEGAAP